MRRELIKYRFLPLLIFHFSFFILNYGQESISLNGSDWSFKKKDDIRYRRAIVPGVVHLDLMRNHMIEDPFWANNELKYQWIENETWIYRKEFTIKKEQLNYQDVDLIFEGLDTYAKVFLNGAFLFESDNMHTGIRERVKEQLKIGENILEVHFLPLSQDERYQKRKYDLPAGCETVKEKRSPWIRKAAYHFGWDWGPRFVTCGIWRDVKIEFFNVQILHPHIYTHSIEDNKAKLIFTALASGIIENPIARLIINGDTLEDKITGFRRDFRIAFDIENPKLWWCNGEGDPNMYEAHLEMLSSKGEVLYREEFNFGIRTVELINEKDSIGTSFYFKLNGRPVFIKGANYIPQDIFLPSVRDENYHQLLNQVDEANMNMLRVWGGGVYEKDIFYNLCDEKGIMVWQDFMFAGSMYPKELQYSIEGEIMYNCLRLRNHPSIAVWCGNNEMEVAWNNWGWQKQFGWSAKDSTEIWETYQMYFHELIPQLLKMYNPSAIYTPTSPLSNWGTAENFNHSSMHYWGVWHGKESFEDYEKNVGRFMVEYGFQSYPEMATINSFCEPKDQKLNSKVMENRQKSYIGNEEIMRQILKYYKKPKTFEEFVERSQDVQAKAMEIAISAHMKAQPHCMGTMFWQLNDCWPGPSWSVIDYYGREKKAYQVVKKLFN